MSDFSETSKARHLRPDGRLMLNEDGRGSATLRPLSCELSCLHRSDGSALWKSGSTHVLAAVYGPVSPRLPSQEKGDEAVVSVVIKSGNHNNAASSSSSSSTGTGMIEREWEQLLINVLTACIDTKLYARTVVEVVLQVVQDDGGGLAAALHAAVAALMDAGVGMTNLPVATTFVIMNHPSSSEEDPTKEKLILLDPSSEEELDPEASVLVLITENERPERILATHSMVACSPTTKTNSNKGTAASLSHSTILSCAQAAAKATPAVVTFWRLAVEQRVTRESQTLWSSS